MKFYIAYSPSNKCYIEFFYNMFGEIQNWMPHQHLKQSILRDNIIKLKSDIKEAKGNYFDDDFPKDVVIQEYSLVKTK